MSCKKEEIQRPLLIVDYYSALTELLNRGLIFVLYDFALEFGAVGERAFMEVLHFVCPMSCSCFTEY
jgi:hypothetical protein